MIPTGRYKAHMEGQLIVITVERLLGLNKVEDNQTLSDIVPDLETFD